jgi:hypothetical protein
MLHGLWDGASEVDPLSLDALVRRRATILGTHTLRGHLPPPQDRYRWHNIRARPKVNFATDSPIRTWTDYPTKAAGRTTSRT